MEKSGEGGLQRRQPSVEMEMRSMVKADNAEGKSGEYSSSCSKQDNIAPKAFSKRIHRPGHRQLILVQVR